jgi:hypothetical protein
VLRIALAQRFPLLVKYFVCLVAVPAVLGRYILRLADSCIAKLVIVASALRFEGVSSGISAAVPWCNKHLACVIEPFCPILGYPSR